MILSLANSVDFTKATEKEKRVKIGNGIFEYVAMIYGTSLAPKLTGMIVDLPIIELMEAVKTHDKLKEKLTIAKALLETSSSDDSTNAVK